MSGLHADFAVTRTAFDLRVRLSVPPGRVTALVGPNGAGKSTALRTIAGLIRPTEGTIELDGRRLDGDGAHLPARARGIGVVFQDYLLFPHLSALENVAFGPIAHGAARADAHRAAHDLLARFGLAAHADSRPGRLSGGQAQRVALARALALEPSLLLLDEPLAALDAGTRMEVRTELGARLRAYGGATVLVTHDVIDAITLADEIVVLERGVVVQRGTPAEITSAPATEYVARLVGMNLLRTGESTMLFSPADVALSTHPPTMSVPASWRCRLVALDDLGGRLVLTLETTDGLHRFRAETGAGDPAIAAATVGEPLWAAVTKLDVR